MDLRPNFLSLDRGKTYVFNQNDSSNNSQFLLLSETNDGWHSTGDPASIGQTSFLYLGVQYFIDGSEVSTFAEYTSAFNGATSRNLDLLFLSQHHLPFILLIQV